jgi:toxin ParE1/3/4
MSRFRLSARAAADLDEIWLTIAQDDIAAADRVIDRLHAAAALIATRSRIGRARNELGAELRSFVTKTPYLIYYVPASDGIAVVRVLHHARDVDAIFSDYGSES